MGADLSRAHLSTAWLSVRRRDPVRYGAQVSSGRSGRTAGWVVTLAVGGAVALGSLAGCSPDGGPTSEAGGSPSIADGGSGGAPGDGSSPTVAGVPESPGADRTSSGEGDGGARRWAVVLAGASEPSDPILELAVADATGAGLEGAVTNCDRGAAEALGMAPAGTYTVSVYADTNEAAEALLGRLVGMGVEGVVAAIVQECPD